jgi:trehalose 6-phosphate synthase/phosphatase
MFALAKCEKLCDNRKTGHCMTKYRFITVSNRLPISVSKRKGQLVFTQSSGGLATAMSSLRTDDQLWIGWPGISSDELSATEKKLITEKLLKKGCAPVFLTKAQVQGFYNDYANDTLWPLFHYFQSFARYDDASWHAYQTVNELFAEQVARYAHPKATVWVHDYHLMLAPQLLRNLLPGATIGFFLHTPFPSYEIFRLLPSRKTILEGLLGADLIGFHIYDYTRHFLSSVLRICGIENNKGVILNNNRVIKTDVFPIGIDYKKFTRALNSKKTQTETATLRKRYKNQKIILSVDRLDYSKGIPKRLDAYEKFLADHPEHHGKVVLVVVAVPSRTEVASYQELRETVEQSISRINGTFGTIDWTPVSYQFQNLPFSQISALYQAAEVALVTPLRDGMNLVAKEFIASQQIAAPGVLILSEMAGASDELPEAIKVNPMDIDDMARALHTALLLPKKERQTQLHSMQRRLSHYTIQHWAADFVDQLGQTEQLQTQNDNKLLTAAAEQRIAMQFKKARRRLILLDYDGTLANFVPTPDPAAATPSTLLTGLLTDLTQLDNTTVAIVSGRPRAALESWFHDIPALALAAEHGAWLKSEGKWHQEKATLAHHREAILAILGHFAERTPGVQIEQKDFAIVWHYRNVPPELAFARNAQLRYELKQLLGDTDIGVYNGSKVIEIKPQAIHKGAVCDNFLAHNPADFILCIGDDYTDEDMFKALPAHAYTVKVGIDDTAARHQIASVEKVLQLLNQLVKHTK